MDVATLAELLRETAQHPAADRYMEEVLRRKQVSEEAKNSQNSSEISNRRFLRYERWIMKIVVIGGGGLTGKELVTRLRERGHEAVAASRSSGVNAVTGAGLADVLVDAEVVVDAEFTIL
jgi:NADH dehydrogenase FAD-containing subunit